ncbi:M55 family metallopeptidase [Desulfobacter sp. UBA2225]|uniref:M55 family metallopeptidase n=1 Tax=Desulfobacter sp. UBA2225 TaxID=1961413 RepID=UPI002579959C|nr:M55 family metallopeptidase [Desulfobacter sp. UBA2225]
MYVGVFADIEGSFGIWRMRQCRMGTREWQYGRICLTEDVNHVVRGAFDGGAARVTVKDNHEVGFNCLINRLDPRAEYIGGHYVEPSLFGDVTGLDLILYVAIHAASGTPDAFFPHTHYGVFSELRLNGAAVGEMDIYGGYLGELGIPIGFVSGEDVAVEQALRVLPWAKAVTVDKSKAAYTSGEKSRRYLAEGRERLRRTAAEAVAGGSLMKPLIIKGPLHFEAVFRTEQLARQFNTWNFPRQGDTVSWDAADMREGFDKLNRLTFFRRNLYPVRRPLTFLMRNYYRIKNTYFAPLPDPEGAPL